MSKLKSMTIPIEEIGLSQLAAGEGAGVTAGTIGNYERGLRGMDVAKINQILHAFGMVVTSITFTSVSHDTSRGSAKALPD